MLRVAAWTGGLFAIGAGVAHYFPGGWTEPLVLAALGATMLLLGSRGPARSTAAATVKTPAPQGPAFRAPQVPPAPPRAVTAR